MEELLDLLKNFNIVFADNVNDFLKCTICTNVLVDSCFSPCACKFCWGCIEHYLRNGGRPCPGVKDECKETFLDTVDELIKDLLSNMLISNLLVECPNENCDYRCQLRKLPEHMKTCTKSAVECVFSYVGCAYGSVSKNKMKEHLEEQSVAHWQAFLTHTRSMENDMKHKLDRYEVALEMLTAENEVFRRTVEGNSTEFERIKEEVRATSSNEAMFMSQIAQMTEEIRLLSSKEEMLTLKNVKLEGELQSNRENIALLQMRLDEYDKRQENTHHQMQHICEGSSTDEIIIKEEVSLRLENVKTECQTAQIDLKQQAKKRRKESDDVQQDGVNRVHHLDSPVQQFNFVWRIERISTKLDKPDEYSLPFLSDRINGYKLCMRFCMHSCRGMRLTFHLMCGEYDNFLQWPMIRPVLIEIIDENSEVTVISRRVRRVTVPERKDPRSRLKAYDRPMSKMNDFGDGFVECFTYDQIKLISGAIHNDVMTVRCCVLRQ